MVTNQINIMKNNTLLLVGLIVFSCNQSKPEKELPDILSEIQAPASSTMYFRNIQSLPYEIAFLGAVVQKTDSAQNPVRFGLLKTHLQCGIDLLNSYNELVTNMEKLQSTMPLPNYSQSYQTMAVASQCKKLPCPIDTIKYFSSIKNIAFYTIDSAAVAELFKNDSLIVLNKGLYFPDLRIRKLSVSADLHTRSGDSIRIEMPVSFTDSLGTTRNITIIYGKKL